MKYTVKAEIKRLAMKEYEKLKHNYTLKQLNFEPFSTFNLPTNMSVN